MTALFSVDCHACGAKNTIDAETMRNLGPVPPRNPEAAAAFESARELIRQIKAENEPQDAA